MFSSGVAVIFGLMTLIVGTRVLVGVDPGYQVFLPLLIYNTLMGAVYIAAGIAIWFSLRRGTSAAATIFTCNILVLAVIGYLFTNGADIAIESVRAMTLRTVVWLVLCVVLSWERRRQART